MFGVMQRTGVAQAVVIDRHRLRPNSVQNRQFSATCRKLISSH